MVVSSQYATSFTSQVTSQNEEMHVPFSPLTLSLPHHTCSLLVKSLSIQPVTGHPSLPTRSVPDKKLTTAVSAVTVSGAVAAEDLVGDSAAAVAVAVHLATLDSVRGSETY